MEGVIGNIVSKIDRVLIKLETMEKSKSKKKQNLGKLFDGLTNDEGGETSQHKLQSLTTDLTPVLIIFSHPDCIDRTLSHDFQT